MQPRCSPCAHWTIAVPVHMVTDYALHAYILSYIHDTARVPHDSPFTMAEPYAFAR